MDKDGVKWAALLVIGDGAGPYRDEYRLLVDRISSLSNSVRRKFRIPL